jgi:hypothetical protein
VVAEGGLVPVVDFLEPQPPTVTVNQTDGDVLSASAWPSSTRTRTDAATYDLTGVVIERSAMNVAPVKIRRTQQPPGTVVTGGVIRHTPTGEPTWDDWHANYGAVVETPGVTFIGTRFHSLGDGVQFAGTGTDWRLVDCWFSDIHDDAVENDGKHSGLVDSCVIDGAHIAFSAASATAADRLSAMRIVNTMVRLRPQRESYKPEKYGYDQHGPFFKWSPDAPHVDVRDCIFRSDTPARYGGNVNGRLGLPPGSSGSNVILIGTDAWSAQEVASWVDQVDNVTFASADAWDNALKYRATRPLPQGDIL